MMPNEPDHYGVLELKPGSPMEDVKSQYRRLAKRYHPDLHGDDAGFQEKFRRVNAAYTFLSDAPRKAGYDAVLEAARKAKTPSPTTPKPSATATGYHARPSPNATGYHAPPAATRFHRNVHDQTATDVRMKRSAWLGATAGAIVVLLVIGLSLDGSGPAPPALVGAGSPTAPGSAAGSALGMGREEKNGNGSEPGADSDPAVDPLPPPFAAPAADAALHRRLPMSVPSAVVPMRSGIPSGAWLQPRVKGADPAKEADPAEALGKRLLRRYRAVLPRTDRLLGRGYAVRAASAGTEDGSRRILRDQLAADLADLSAARDGIQPAVARLSRQSTPAEVNQEAGRVLVGLHRLENTRQPVQDDIKALAVIAPGLHASPVFPASPIFHASPVVSHFSPPAPPKAASVVPTPTVPTAPTPAVAPVAPSSPKPPEKVEVKQAAKVEVKQTVKPKAPASSGQEFIMWGK